jgi:recombinational DNA repair protein RecT
MARKTVYRKLIGKWGVMSIDYQSHGDAVSLAAQMQEEYDLENPTIIEGAGMTIIDTETGEVE